MKEIIKQSSNDDAEESSKDPKMKTKHYLQLDRWRNQINEPIRYVAKDLAEDTYANCFRAMHVQS